MKIIIVGGNAAGMSAASRARRNDPNAEIVVFEKSGDVSYGACGLPFFVSDEIKNADDLIAISAEDFESKRNIKVQLYHEVESFDARKKTIQMRDLKNDKQLNIGYDKLVIATGASAVVPGIPGKDLKNVFYLKTLEDGKRLKSFCENDRPENAVIVGAGYIGLEVAEALKKRGINVSVVEAASQVLPYLDFDMAEMVEKHLKENSVQVYTSTVVTAILGREKVERIALADGRELKADLVLLAVGIKPNVDFAKKSGVVIGKTGAIKVNNRMQTNLRNVYAAGDCAEAKCRVINKSTWVPLGTTANKQGKVAGDNVSDGKSKFNGITSTSVVKVFDLAIASTGLNSKLANDLKMDFATEIIRSKTRAHYYPGYKDISVKLLFEKSAGKLLGAQIVGGEGVAKRIDVLATALYNNMTVEQVSELDLSYTPPFAPVWDAILLAANQALKKVRN